MYYVRLAPAFHAPLQGMYRNAGPISLWASVTMIF